MNSIPKKQLIIDSCAWDIFYKFSLDLTIELPANEFDIFMTKEVMSFEVPHMPSDLLDYVTTQTSTRGINELSWFGFPSYEQHQKHKSRTSGFGTGQWPTYQDAEAILMFKPSQGLRPKTGLNVNEADASMAARAYLGATILTAENPNKKGPLKDVIIKGGKVIDLCNFDPLKCSLRLYIAEYA